MNKKRILFIRPSLGYGGADRVTLNLINNYDSSKYDVSLALMHDQGELQESLTKSVPFYNLNVRSLWFSVGPIVKLMNSKKFDVVYSTSGGMSIPMMIASIISKYKGLSIVSERNSLDRTYSSLLKKKLLLGLKKFLYKRADVVTTVSAEIGNQINQKFKVPFSKIKQINNPLIDDRFYSLLNETIDEGIIDKNKISFLAVGRFVKQKDYPTLLKAFKTFNVDTPNSELIILGKGPLKEKIVSFSKDLKLHNSVKFLGFDSNPYKYMKNADVFVLSSLHEGMPGVLIQAMAAGLAVISTDCPTGPNEIIVHNKNGILVKVGDDLAIALEMERLSKNLEERISMGKNALKAVKKYEVKEAVNSYFSVLDK